jgi:hypothetical protein
MEQKNGPEGGSGGTRPRSVLPNLYPERIRGEEENFREGLLLLQCRLPEKISREIERLVSFET